MLFSPIEEGDDSPTSTISSDSNPTPPDPDDLADDENAEKPIVSFLF